MTHDDAKAMLARWQYEATVRKVKRNADARIAWRKSQKHICHYCGKLLASSKRMVELLGVRAATVDHKTPLSRGGKDDPSNWAMCCHECNSSKANKTEAEFRKTKEAP